MHNEFGTNVVVTNNCRQLSVRGAHHNENDGAIGVFECHSVDIFAVSCSGDAFCAALNKLGEVTNVVVNGSENKLLCFGVIENGRVAAGCLILKYDACNGGGACGAVVERSAFFAQEQVPVAKTCGEVIEVANELFAVSFGKADGVFVNGATVFGAEQNLAELFVHESHAVKVVARIPVVTNRPNAILNRFGGEDLLGTVVNAFFVVVPNDDFDIGKHCSEVIDNEGQIVAVKFKTVRQSGSNASIHTRTKYTKDEIDYFSTSYKGKCYLVPVEHCSIEKLLRIVTPKNGQLKGVSFLKDYELSEVLKTL